MRTGLAGLTLLSRSDSYRSTEKCFSVSSFSAIVRYVKLFFDNSRICECSMVTNHQYLGKFIPSLKFLNKSRKIKLLVGSSQTKKSN